MRDDASERGESYVPPVLQPSNPDHDHPPEEEQKDLGMTEEKKD